MKRIFIPLFACLWMPYSTLLAQNKMEYENANSHNITIGLAPSFVTAKDEIYSSMVFSGPAISVKSGWEYLKEKRVQGLTLAYSSGSLKAKNSSDKLKLSNLGVKYYFYYSIDLQQNDNWKIDAGAQVAFGYNQRKYSLINSNKSYEQNLTLEPLIGISYFLPHTDQYYFSNHLYFSILSFIKQPVFGDDSIAGTYDTNASSNIFTNWKTAGIGTYSALSNKLAFHKKTVNRNQLSLEYEWNYFSIKTVRPVKQAVHQLTIRYAINL